jgi:ribonuclease HI
VGAAAVCIHGSEWSSHHSYLGARGIDIFDTERWVTGLVLDVVIKKIDPLMMHGEKTVAVASDSQVAMQHAAHLDPGPGQRLARQINRSAQSLLTHGITTQVNWVQGHSHISGKEDADSQAYLACDSS